MKLTKANKEVIQSIANGFISSMLINALIQGGEEVTPELVQGIGVAISQADTTELQSEIVKSITAQGVDIKVLAKVSKYLAQPDVQGVMAAVQNVATEVQDVLTEVVRGILVEASKAGE